MLIDILFLFGVLCGCAAALRRSRTATLLLIKEAVAAGLLLVGVDYDPWLWLAIDLAVVVNLIRPTNTLTDDFINVSFIPIWAFYFFGGPETATVISLIVTLQFLLIFPTPQILGYFRRRYSRNSGQSPPSTLSRLMT